MKKVTLLLMSEKGLECLRYIIDKFGADVIDKVYTRPDKSITKDYFNEICNLCKDREIRYFDPEAIKNNGVDIESDLALAISWRWLVDTDKKLVVLHDSPLPKYKGWNPLVTTLINEDPVIGVTAFIADDLVDEGEIVTTATAMIEYPIKIADAITKIIPLYCQVCEVVLNEYLNNGIITNYGSAGLRPQESYSMWREEDDYQIDWYDSAVNIINFVNAVGTPYKGAQTMIPVTGVIRIFDCEQYPDVEIINREKHIGKVIFVEDDKYVVVAGDGLVKINDIQGLGGVQIKAKKFRVRFK